MNRLFYKLKGFKYHNSIKMAKNSEDARVRAEIQRAINITRDVEEPYRLKAFEIVLSKSLNGFIAPEKKVDQKNLGISQPLETTTLNAKIEAFAAKCNLSIEQLKNVYNFAQDKPDLVVSLDGKQSEKQIIVSRLLLAAYEEVYSQEWLSLSKALESHGVGSLKHLSETLENKPEIFLKKGEKKYRQYKLVLSAKVETFKMINQMASGVKPKIEPEGKQGGVRKELFSPKIDELIDEGYFKLPNRRKAPDVLTALKEKGLPTSGKGNAVLESLKRRLGKKLKGTKEGNDWVFWTE
jgi:hypothetical protein